MADATPTFKGRHASDTLVKVVCGKPRATAAASAASGARQSVPEWVKIAEDPLVAAAMRALPSNYEFEVPKTIARVRRDGARVVALQFPEGLLAFSLVIADIIERFTGAEVTVLGDVVYGACCVDDLSAEALGADLLVHYGHSCLVPVSATRVPCMYVFVEISFDPSHLVAIVRDNVPPTEHLAIMGTIQFAPAVAAAREALAGDYPNMWVPQEKPLSPGEVLGCTSPRLPRGTTVLVFVADGRFHLESAMIHNPEVRALRYDPYSKVMTAESYDTDKMTSTRAREIARAQRASRWGVVVGTLGRQGNPRVVDRLRALLASQGKPVTVVLLSEVFPAKLALMADVEAWVQVCCPRLSVDWGDAFADAAPLLAPYEAFVALRAAEWMPGGVYPMDFYSAKGGPWTNYYRTPEEEDAARKAKEAARAARRARRKQLQVAKSSK